jgi:plasmid maintenance system antidote protein VapI
MKNQSKTIEKIIKAEILKAKETRYAIAKKLGISEGMLCRLMQGKRGLSIYMAEKLLDYFGYKITKRKRGL